MTSHHHEGARPGPVQCALVTVSDTRTPATDVSGARMREILEAAGHRVVRQDVLPDEPDQVAAHLRRLIDDPAIECIVTSGGTGIAARDTTYEAVIGLLDKRLDGFGELFRWLSFQEIGPAAMLSRAMAGVAGRTLVAVLPGATAAVELGLTRLLVPELRHMVHLVREA